MHFSQVILYLSHRNNHDILSSYDALENNLIDAQS